MPSKIRVLQFLSMINDGEKLDWAFGSDDSTTPLESAIEVLTDLNEFCRIPQEDMEKVCTSIKEMLVVICLKNGKFEKAKDILTRLFPSGMVGKKAILMGLANQKVNSHALLEQSNFKKFKEDMVDFSLQLFPSSAAMQLVDKRLLEQGGGAPEEGEADLADASSDTVALCLVSGFRDQFINKERLVAVYTVMSGTSQPTFSQLEKEYYDSASVALPAPSDGLSQGGGSGSLREASVADLQHVDAAAGPPAPPLCPGGRQRPRGGYSIAQLVQEPDSLVFTQEPPRKSDSFECVDSDSDVYGCSVGKRRKRRKLLDNASESKATWSDEESTFSSYRGSSNSKKPWSEQESNMLREAVARFGEGNWSKIMARYKFKNRTNVNLKDRWRTMKRLKLV
ncbi:LOW QUALITY PROTEIN: hypothetical protein CRUP_004857 [Coryphaenoides rupestris]|nr:LOW QUALITY PROTEIN: hypothetical protein CRUP_004857 [Coryphaenoides rupestris]